MRLSRTITIGWIVAILLLTILSTTEAMAASADIDGNDAEELVALGKRNCGNPATERDAIVIHDSRTGTRLKLICVE